MNQGDATAVHYWQLEQCWAFKALTHCFCTVKSKEVLRGTFAANNDAQGAYAACVRKYENALDVINLRTTKEQEVKDFILKANYKGRVEY